MNYSDEFEAALAFVFIASLLWITAKLMKLNVPLVYGRHDKGQYRIQIPYSSIVDIDGVARLFGF